MNAAETEPGFALPPLRPDNVFFNWFPTDFHCFVYRNWGMVSPEKMGTRLNRTSPRKREIRPKTIVQKK